MNIQEYLEEQLQEVQLMAEASGTLAAETFTSMTTEILVEAGELRDFTHAALIGKRGVLVHGYDTDPKDADNILSIVVVDYVQQAPSGTLTQTEMDTLFRRATTFISKCLEEDFRFDLEPTSPVWELADLINVRWPYIEKMRIILVTNKLLSSRVDGRDHGEIDGKRVVYSVWDLGRFHQLETSSSGREELVIDLIEEFGTGFPAIEATLNDSEYQSYLLVVPGPQLAAIYDRWHDRLLEQNVRVFLQARSKVNRGIRDTIRHHPERFFAYNNGISATAESADVIDNGSGLRITALRNLQIVNGGQTTASVHSALKTDAEQLKRVAVQMKLTIVEPENATEIVPKISEYANSQNTVSAADFFSNHPFHVYVENASRRIGAPSADGTFRQSKWFYERARGQYNDERARLTGARRTKFDLEFPKSQFFNKTDLAKFDTVWRLLPHEVSKGAQKVFSHFSAHIGRQWEKDQSKFNDQTYRDYIAKAIIFKSTERLVSNAEWYEGGYRANIVAYTIAKLASDILNMGKAVDFDRVWKEQSISQGLAEALLIYGQEAQTVILNPQDVRNISEWAKREECWKVLETTKVSPPTALKTALIDLDVAETRGGDGADEGKIDIGINAQIRVMNANPDFWIRLREWGNENRFLGMKDLSLIKVAATPGKLPTERQSKYLMELVARLEKEGLPFADEI